MQRVPVFMKTGSDILAWVLVDEEDYVDLSRFRWQVSTDGLVVREHVSGRLRLMARQVLGIDIQDKAGVTHIDGDTLNCQKENLRIEGKRR